jgi:apolipoprotein N-acyltransferase
MSARRVVWLRRGVAVGAGVVLGLSRPPVDVGVLALVGLVPLLWLWRDDSLKGAAGHGLLAGVVYHGMVVSWAWYFGAIAIVPFVGALAGYWALAGFLVVALRRRGLASPWLTAAVWVVCEGLVARFPLGGFSWAELGYATHDLAPLRALATLGGLPLVSYAIALGNAALTDALAGGRARRRLDVSRALAVVAVTAVAVAAWFVAWPATTVTGRLHVAMLQGNDKNRDLTAAEEDARYLPATHFALAARLHGRYDLVVFPESSLDADPRHDPWLTAHLVATARRLHAYVLANAVADADRQGKRALNLDVLYAPSGRIVGTYAKRHLVPYGEYVPGRAVLQHVIGELDRIPRDFAPGRRRGLFALSTSDGRHRIATLICFESAFGYQVRPLVRDGAELIVVSTNNRSYRRSSNSWEHIEAGQLRAAETGRTVLQASISGHTAVIDARGRVVTHTALFRNGIVTATVETRRGLTPYVRFGDWALGACILGVLGAATFTVGRRERDPHETGAEPSRSVDSPAELVRGAV